MTDSVDVLVVDDEQDVREMLAELVQGCGYKALVASDGEEALEALRRTRPRLVLLDLRMPRVDGWEFCRRVADDEELRALPIAVVSVEDPKSHPTRREDAGYVRKPIDVERLVEILRARCGVRADDGGVLEVVPVDPNVRPAAASELLRRRVLVAEDDRDIREALAAVIGAEGYDVTAVADGREALEALLEGLMPDVILIDLIMPVIDGWQLCDELAARERLRDIPVILMSASGGPLGPPRPPKLVRFFRKPFTFLQLLQTIEETCEGRPAPH